MAVSDAGGRIGQFMAESVAAAASAAQPAPSGGVSTSSAAQGVSEGGVPAAEDDVPLTRRQLLALLDARDARFAQWLKDMGR